jgi:aryl-alcohol dehydrogenase-like predicted oxidoreductase
METRRIGTLDVSVVGLGCNTFGGFGSPTPTDDARVAAVVGAALDNGITLFDTADIYGDGVSEERLGKSLGARRDEAVIATKVGARRPPGATGAAIVEAVEGSLRRLGTDRIDLYQIHMPDPEVPFEEMLDALNGLVVAGKVREIGCSNFSAEQLDEAAGIASKKAQRPFASVQNEMSLLRSRPLEEVIPTCASLGTAFIPYSPIANGLLSGKYKRGEKPSSDTRFGNLPPENAERALSDRTFDRLDRLDAFARERGHTLLELAIAWLASVPTVASVIAGATRPEQVVANAGAAAWRLTDTERDEALALAR